MVLRPKTKSKAHDMERLTIWSLAPHALRVSKTGVMIPEVESKHASHGLDHHASLRDSLSAAVISSPFSFKKPKTMLQHS